MPPNFAGHGLVGLGERLEQPGDLLGGHADAGVGHVEADRLSCRRGGVADRDAATTPVGGELDRVADQVHQDLLERGAGRSRSCAGIGPSRRRP